MIPRQLRDPPIQTLREALPVCLLGPQRAGTPYRRIAALAAFALWCLCFTPIHSMAEGATHGDLVRNSFQQLLDRWGYQEWWSMWEHGTVRSRSAIPVDVFTQRMDASPWRLACCDKRLRSLQVTPASSHHVIVSATLLFEPKQSKPRPTDRLSSITLHFYLEDQEWRVDLSGLRHP